MIEKRGGAKGRAGGTERVNVCKEKVQDENKEEEEKLRRVE